MCHLSLPAKTHTPSTSSAPSRTPTIAIPMKSQPSFSQALVQQELDASRINEATIQLWGDLSDSDHAPDDPPSTDSNSAVDGGSRGHKFSSPTLAPTSRSINHIDLLLCISTCEFRAECDIYRLHTYAFCVHPYIGEGWRYALRGVVSLPIYPTV